MKVSGLAVVATILVPTCVQAQQLSNCLSMQTSKGYPEVESTCLDMARGEFAFRNGDIVTYTFDGQYRRGRFSYEPFDFRRQVTYSAPSSMAAAGRIKVQAFRYHRDFVYDVLSTAGTYVNVQVVFTDAAGTRVAVSDFMAAPGSRRRAFLTGQKVTATVTRAAPDPR